MPIGVELGLTATGANSMEHEKGTRVEDIGGSAKLTTRGVALAMVGESGKPWLQQSWERVLVCIGLISMLSVTAPPLLAYGGDDDDLDGEGYGEHALLAPLEAVNISLAILGTALFVVAARRRRDSRDGLGLGYIAAATATLGCTRLFYILADRGHIFIHDDTLEFWWHMIFFMAMFLFVCGGKVMSDIEGQGSRLGTPRVLKQWCGITVAVTIACFLSAEPMDKRFVEVFDGTIWDSFGVQHFAAFIVAALTALHLYATAGGRESASTTSVISLIKVPLVSTYALFSLDHFWELLTDSWEIFDLSETTIEQIEQTIVLPAFLAAIYGGWKLRTARVPSPGEVVVQS